MSRPHTTRNQQKEKRRRRRTREGGDVVIEMSSDAPMVTYNHYEGLHANMPKSAPLAVSEYAPTGKGLHIMRQFAAHGGPAGKVREIGATDIPNALPAYVWLCLSLKDARTCFERC